MKAFIHVSRQSIRLLETVFSSSKTMPACLQYGKELFESWSCHTPLTGLPGSEQSPIDHPLYNLGWWVHDRIPSQPPHFPNRKTSWLNGGNAFHKAWVGYNPRLLLSRRKRLIKYIHKGGGHINPDLKYINL